MYCKILARVRKMCTCNVTCLCLLQRSLLEELLALLASLITGNARWFRCILSGILHVNRMLQCLLTYGSCSLGIITSRKFRMHRSLAFLVDCKTNESLANIIATHL